MQKKWCWLTALGWNWCTFTINALCRDSWVVTRIEISGEVGVRCLHFTPTLLSPSGIASSFMFYILSPDGLFGRYGTGTPSIKICFLIGKNHLNVQGNHPD